MAQGQAVGTAAALAVAKGVTPRDINITKLQKTLIDQGVELRQSLEKPDPSVIERIGKFPKEYQPTSGESDEATQVKDNWVS